MLSRNTALRIWAVLAVAAVAPITGHAAPEPWPLTFNQTVTVPLDVRLSDNTEGVTCEWQGTNGLHVSGITGGSVLGEITCHNPGNPVIMTREQDQAELVMENDRQHRIEYSVLTAGNNAVDTILSGATETNPGSGAARPTIGKGSDIKLKVIALTGTGLTAGKYTGVALLNIWTH
ncbi:hypothetical protein DRX19_12600 [Salmonella enterica subsp. enterica]|nr:hypothetical protein [Salmonella enterica subsp. enterica serovar Pensacola]